MVEFDLFISYSSADRAEVEQMARALQAKGLKVFFDRWNLTPGLDWRRRLEEVLGSTRAVAICLGAEMGGWQHREYSLAFDRQTESLRTGHAFPVIPVLLSSCQEPPSGFLRQNTWVDLRGAQQRDELIDTIVQAIQGRTESAQGGVGTQVGGSTGAGEAMSFGAAVATGEAAESFCPYRGLRYFREEDAPSYFGREASITQLLEVVKHRDAVAVLGASGTGKSSLVRAGLIPRLRRSATNTWEFCTVLPGHRPLRELAAAIVALLQYEQDDISLLQQVSRTEQGLRDGSLDLPALVKLVLSKQRGTDRLLLFVDQWEEIYSPQCADTDRQIFIRNILEARTDQVAKLLITIRADFFERAITDSRDFSDAIQGGIFALAPQSEAELLDSIVKPAAALGVPFEPGLPERLLADARQQPGSLPLVEFVLEQLWSHRAGHQALTHASYQQIGGISGAITAKAEELWASLTAPQQDLLKKAFIKLITPGANSADTRRRAALDEFSTETHTVLNRLITGRLLTVSNSDALSATTIEIAHEALLQNWVRLKGWIEEDRMFATWQADILVQASRWLGSQKSSTLMLRGAELKEAQRWLRSRRADISPQGLQYLRASNRRRLKVLVLGAGSFVLFSGVALGWLIQFLHGNYEINHREKTNQMLVSALANDVVPVLQQDGRHELANRIISSIDEFPTEQLWIGSHGREFERKRAELAWNEFIQLRDRGDHSKAYMQIYKTAMILQDDRNKYNPNGPDDSGLAEAYLHFAMASMSEGRNDEALEWLSKARKLVSEHPPSNGQDPEIVLRILLETAIAQNSIEDFSASLKTSIEARELLAVHQEKVDPQIPLEMEVISIDNKIELGMPEEALRDISTLRAKLSQLTNIQDTVKWISIIEGKALLQAGRRQEGSAILERIGAEAISRGDDLKSESTQRQLNDLADITSAVCVAAISEQAYDACKSIIIGRRRIFFRISKRQLSAARLVQPNLYIDMARLALTTDKPEVMLDDLIGQINFEEISMKKFGGFPRSEKQLQQDILAMLYENVSRIEVASGIGQQKGLNSANQAVTNARLSHKVSPNPKRTAILASALTARAEAAKANKNPTEAQDDYREALKLYRELLQTTPKRRYLLRKVAEIERAIGTPL